MTRIIYTFALLFFFSMASAQTLWGITREGWDATTPDGLGERYVCEEVGFNTSFAVPQGEMFVKRDWYYNDALIIANGEGGVKIPMKNGGVNNIVYCIFTYRKSDGSTYTVRTNSAVVRCAGIGVTIDAPSQVSFECTTPITLSIREYEHELGGVRVEPPQVPYTVEWQLLPGWSVQSSTDGSKSLVVVPDKYSSGSIRAKVTLACGATMNLTHNISRPVAPAPTFTAFPTPLCGANIYIYTVTPVCGASSYTFTSSNNNLLFSNGLNTITTTEPSCGIVNAAQYNMNVELRVKANFDNNTSTTETMKVVQVGKITSIALNPYTWDCNSELVFVSVKNPQLYPYLDWYRVDNGEYVGSGTSISLPKDGFFYDVHTANECGASVARVRVMGGICPISFSISPNPVSSNLRVVMPAASTTTAKSAASDISFKLYNVNTTTLVKSWKVKAGEKEYNFSVAGLPKGQYIVQAEGAGGKSSQRIIIE